MSNNELEISNAAKLLGIHGLEAGFLIPTATGMDKGIMDATWPLREYLKRTGFHDFSTQGQGIESKRILPIHLIHSTTDVIGKISLYRPNTKNGDPRLWISKLSTFANPSDLLALIVDSGELFVINCTQLNLSELLIDASTPLGQIAARLNTKEPVAKELLGKLKSIASMGYIQTMRSGDTGVGYTLETLLSISANSRKTPDYDGIELKSARLSKKSRSNHSPRTTLFSLVPNWELSPCNPQVTLKKFGYIDPATARLQLYCSVDINQNSLGFKLDPRFFNDSLVTVNSKHVSGGEDVFLWCMENLRKSFTEKHHETFWIKAKAIGGGAQERFHYVEARHTRNPPLATFERLLATGGICVDLTMSEKTSSKVRDHGYLFRVYGRYFDELFPEAGVYSLV